MADTLADTSIYEKLGGLASTARAAHVRIDTVEHNLGSDMRELKSDIKELTAAWNRAKGWIAALVLFSGLIGAAASIIVAFMTK